MSYTNNWANELKEAYIGEFFGFGKKKPDPKPKPKPKTSKPVKKQPKLDPKAMDYALGVHGKYTYDHVEHQGKDLQEEIALNEHLLSLIEALCEELGIDVEELLEQVNVEDQPHGTVVKSSLGWRAKRRKKASYDDRGGEDEHEHFDSREEGEEWVKSGRRSDIKQTGVSWTHVSTDENERRKAQRQADHEARLKREREDAERGRKSDEIIRATNPLLRAAMDRRLAQGRAEWDRGMAALRAKQAKGAKG
jgi:hypothetical protein